MISFTEDARNFLVKKGMKELFLILKYIQGPCTDNLCKLIPKVVVSTEKETYSNFTLIYDESVKVYAIPPIAKSIQKHGDLVTIGIYRIGKKFYAKGITQSF